MKKISLGSVFLFVLTMGLSASCGSQSCDDKVEQLYINNNGKVLIKMGGDLTAVNCTMAGGIWITMRPDETPAYKEIYATLLSSKMANKNIYVRVIEGSNPCSIAHVRLDD